MTRALEPSRWTGIAELIIVFVDDLFTDIGCGLFWRAINIAQDFSPAPRDRALVRLHFAMPVLVPVEPRQFWCPSLKKPSNVCLCGYAERLAYAHVIFRSDICLTKRVVSVWGSILGPTVQG